MVLKLLVFPIFSAGGVVVELDEVMERSRWRRTRRIGLILMRCSGQLVNGPLKDHQNIGGLLDSVRCHFPFSKN